MELVKQNIHMNRYKNTVSTQITLDDDFIVPDSMDDLTRVILSSGDVQIENTRVQSEKILIKGKMTFQVLYRGEDGGLWTLAGSVPFEETVNVPDLTEKDYVQYSWDLEDLTAAMIHSRKINVKGLIGLRVRVESLEDAQAATAVTGDVEKLGRDIEVASIAVRRKDTFRIREEIQISANKPNIGQILWSEMKLQGVNCRLLDGKIRIEGDLVLFVIYNSENEGMPLQWMEETVRFAGDVEVPEVVEEMIPAIGVRLVHRELEAKPDADGEMRVLSVDAVVELDMKLYEQETVHLLSDLYSTKEEVVLELGEACFDTLLVKNDGKCRVAEKVKLPDTDRILQICHADGAVKLDEITMEEDGVHMEGVLEVRILYLTADDEEPLRASSEVLPFQYVAEADGAEDTCACQVQTGVEQLTAMMGGGDTVEIKGVVSLDVVVLKPVKESVVVSARTEPQDLKKLQEMPGIVGYVAQPGDSLWSIAKKFHTTRDDVMDLNGLTDETVKVGDKLILQKRVS